MSVHRCQAEIICSLRVFRILTPERTLGEDKFASARGTTGSDLVGSGKVGAQQCTGRSHRGESEMRRAVLICAVLAALSPTYAEAAERIWRMGVLTPVEDKVVHSVILPY